VTKRLFAAIEVPETLRKVLVDLDPEIAGVRWVDSNQMHLTLGFFGDVAVDAESALRDKLSAVEFGGFFLPITGIGTFPPKGAPKIIWIGVGTGHPHLFQVHKRVQEAAIAAGIEADLRPWHPHFTLARCRTPIGKDLPKFLKRHADFDIGMARVDAFHLYSSELTLSGPIHTCELTVPGAAVASFKVWGSVGTK
jgi:2'-5' RNA ligase